MTGQDALNVAESFHGSVGIDGVILTKMDGDARGGAALSVKSRNRSANQVCWQRRKTRCIGSFLSGANGF